MHLEPESDLHWTAFLYLLGELSVAEASSFELRLADDQDARDALTGAVELAEALAVVGAEPRAGRRPALRRALVGISALAAAACVALSLVPRFRPDPVAPSDASDVALAWSSLRGDAEWPSIPPGPDGLGPGPLAEADEDAGIEAGPSADRPLPSWLLSAASAPLDDSPRVED